MLKLVSTRRGLGLAVPRTLLTVPTTPSPPPNPTHSWFHHCRCLPAVTFTHSFCRPDFSFFLSIVVTPRPSLPLCASRLTIIASSSSSSSHHCQLFIDEPPALCSRGLIFLNDLQTTAAGSLLSPSVSDGDPRTQTAKMPLRCQISSPISMDLLLLQFHLINYSDGSAMPRCGIRVTKTPL